MQRFYRPDFEKQATGSALQWFNCAAASGAMLADQATLGIVDPEPDRVRALTGDFTGGLTMGALGTAMERLGVPVTVYDNDDRLTWPEAAGFLRRGHFMVVAGDYDALPVALRGDKDYLGPHGVLYQQMGLRAIVVGDPLNDGRAPGIHRGFIKWPIDVARRYVGRFDAQTVGGIHAVVMRPEWVKPRSQVMEAAVRAHHRSDAFLLGALPYGRRLVTGGAVDGEEIRGSKRWFRVWWPADGRLGYVHSSVVYRA